MEPIVFKKKPKVKVERQPKVQQPKITIPEPQEARIVPTKALTWMVARMKAMYKKCSQAAPCWDYIREVEAMIKP